MHLFDLTLTNQEQILPLEQIAIFSHWRLLFSENGGPLTDNVVFISQQRFFARKAVLKVTGLHQQISIIRSISFYPVLLTRIS